MPTQRDFSALQELSIGGNLVRGFLEAYDCRDFLRFTTVGGGGSDCWLSKLPSRFIVP
jgi:hypothetical protein